MMMTSPLYPPVSLLNTEQREIHSTIVGQDYIVKIRLPERYHETPDRLYPVLYLMDGDHAFGMAVDIVQYLIYGGYIPDLIIVSPAYGSKNGPSEGGSNMRARDLLAFEVPWLNYASHPRPQGEAFRQFLEQELIPFAESEYRIDSTDRTLWGYSAGSFLGLYALFANPGQYQRYIMVDGFDEGLMPFESQYAGQHTDLAAKLYLSYCAEKHNPSAPQFTETLLSRHYKSLTLHLDLLNNIGHFAVPAEGLTKGLVWIFGDESNKKAAG